MTEKDRDLAMNDAPAGGSRRAREIVASLRAGEAADVFDAVWQLDQLPTSDVSEALTDWTGPLPDLDRLDPATRLAHGLPLRPLRLRVLASVKDADLLDLGPVAEEQLRIAGKSWDGLDLAAEERLDGEIEGSFAGTVERRVFADAEVAGDVPLFDVLLFAEDAGVVFAAGTTTVVALIAYRKVEMRDRRTRAALEEAIARDVEPAAAAAARVPAVSSAAEKVEEALVNEAPRGEHAPATETKVAPTQGAAAKPAAKKPLSKKPDAKAAMKRGVAKKPVAEKVSPEKSAAKKAAAKPPAAKPAPKKGAVTKAAEKKKPEATKPGAKKAAPKKVATTKPAAKKAATKSVAAKKTAKKARSKR